MVNFLLVYRQRMKSKVTTKARQRNGISTDSDSCQLTSKLPLGLRHYVLFRRSHSKVSSRDKGEALTTTASNAASHALDLVLELLDNGMTLFEILVETIALGDELLLPGSESLFLNLDLLCEALPQGLLFLLELGVVEFARPGLSEFARLHLLSSVSLVVVLLGCVDQVEHVGADEDSAKLLEIAVVFILNLGDTPSVLATLDGAAVGCGDILFAADDGKRHGVDQRLGVLHGGIVVFLERRLVDFDTLGVNNVADL